MPERRRGASRSGRAAGRITLLLVLGLVGAACGGTTATAGPSNGSIAVGGASLAPSPTSPAESALPSVTPSLAATPGPNGLPAGVLASIPLGDADRVGGAPSAAAIGYGSVWVETHRALWIYRIDPATNKVIATIDVGQQSCGEPGIGFGRVWVTPCDASTKTIAIDAATNKVVGSFDAGGGSMAFTSDALWIPNAAGRLLEVDPPSYRTLTTLDPFKGGAVDGAANVVGLAGYIWASDETPGGTWGGSIAKIDPVAGKVISLLPVPDPGAAATMTADFGYLWAKGTDDDRLLRIDPTSGAITTFHLPGFSPLSQLYDIWPATGLGSLWLRMSDGVVSRVDPETGTVVGTYPADPTAGGGWPVVGFGSLWVPNFGRDTVWRDGVTP